jgi:hypothetical protein
MLRAYRAGNAAIVFKATDYRLLKMNMEES